MKTALVYIHKFFFLPCMLIISMVVWAADAPASMCDDPALLPVDHVAEARCTVVKNPNVSEKAEITLGSADMCVVKGRDYAYGENEAYDRSYGRGTIYYIGGSIGFNDPATGDFITQDNFGQYWSNSFDPSSLSLIYQTFSSLRFFEWVSCGLGRLQRYRTNGWLDKRNQTLRYKHVNCYGKIELDFELQCEQR
jgi:hypothetical protein